MFPKYWRDEGPVMEARNGILIVRASKGVHHEIERELNRERSKLQKPGLHEAHKDRFEKIRVNLSVDKQALLDVVKTLQIQTGLNLTIDSRIHADVKGVTIVALKAKDMPLTTVLEMVAGQAGDNMLWISRGDVAVLTAREFAN